MNGLPVDLADPRLQIEMRQRTTITTRELGRSEDDQRQGSKSLFKEVDSALGQEGPLDEGEQARLIQGFEDIQIKQARAWRVGGR